MDELLAMLHPPGWTIWQTIGTGAMLTVGYAIGTFVVSVVRGALSRLPSK